VSAGSAVKAVVPEIMSAFNLAAVTEVEASLAVETVPSLGTPRSRTSPSIWIKLITSPVTKLAAKVIVEPLTV